MKPFAPEGSEVSAAPGSLDLPDYPFTTPPEPDEILEVAPDVFWVRLAMPMRLNHINVWLLRDAAGWTLVDTGLHGRSTREAWAVLMARHFGGLPLRAVVCTHAHPDHAGQADWLCRTHGVPLYMTYGEYHGLRALGHVLPNPAPAEEVQFYAMAGLPAERTAAIFRFLQKDPFVHPHPGAYRRLRHGDTLEAAGRRWHIRTGEGHSPEHACLFAAAPLPLLIAGDQLLPRITSNVMVTPTEPEADPLGLWLDSLHALQDLHPDTLVLPAHGLPFRGAHARLHAIIRHHEEHLEHLAAHLQAHPGASAFDCMQVMYPTLSDGPFETLLGLGETLAHLHQLRTRGQAWRHTPEQPDSACRWHGGHPPGALGDPGAP